MTAQQAVLLLGAITLVGCGAGLTLIHDSNPLLKGLNWMGNALLMGGAAAAFTFGAIRFGFLEPVSYLCLLFAFTCCYRAERYLIELDSRPSRLSLALLAFEAVAGVLQWCHLMGSRAGILTVSLLMAVQIESTARLVARGSEGKARLPGQMTAGLMHFVALSSVLRGLCGAAGLLSRSAWADSLNLLSYGFFLSTAIAMAFAFFWRTTTKLSLDLEHMASTDPLTRVYNRRVFLSWCASEQSRSQQMNAPFSVLMLDFDYFKRVNDTYGHHVGDQVLCAAVERIQDSIRGIDVLCRWGGEEFTVLLPNASAEATLIVAERVRRNIRSIQSADPRFAGDQFADLQLSASIGTATYEGPEDSFEAMLQRADAALYEAKRNGRNQVIRSGGTRTGTGYGSNHLVLEHP